MDMASAGIVQNLPIPCIVWKFPKLSVMNSANSLPVITVDAGFVEIRQHNGELHALYVNNAHATYLVFCRQAHWYQLFSIKRWLYKREILLSMRKLMKYMNFPQEYLERNHPRYVRRFVRKFFTAFPIVRYANYGYKPKHEAENLVPGPLVVGRLLFSEDCVPIVEFSQCTALLGAYQ